MKANRIAVMDAKTMLEQDPNAFVIMIKNRVGSVRFWNDEDLTQVFWLGVMKGTKNVMWDEDKRPIVYLIERGFGEIRDYLASERLRSLVKRCPECGREYSYRKMTCWKCECELVIENRLVSFDEYTAFDRDVLDLIEVEQFVDTLTGKMRYVARRWLLDRADLHFDNHLKQIADEMKISAPRAAQYKDQIRAAFRAWRKA